MVHSWHTARSVCSMTSSTVREHLTMCARKLSLAYPSISHRKFVIHILNSTFHVERITENSACSSRRRAVLNNFLINAIAREWRGVGGKVLTIECKVMQRSTCIAATFLEMRRHHDGANRML